MKALNKLTKELVTKIETTAVKKLDSAVESWLSNFENIIPIHDYQKNFGN